MIDVTGWTHAFKRFPREICTEKSATVHFSITLMVLVSLLALPGLFSGETFLLFGICLFTLSFNINEGEATLVLGISKSLWFETFLLFIGKLKFNDLVMKPLN